MKKKETVEKMFAEGKTAREIAKAIGYRGKEKGEAITPLPWYATTNLIQSASINEDNFVAEVEGRNVKESRDNAEFIVRAVNSHAELVEALKLVREKYQEHFESMPLAWQSVDNAVNEALAKAEGK